jgi:glycosyltransferase involved in cell wall biosynthesis
MTIGLMVTRNEEHFIKYALPPLRVLCNKVIVLDASTDGTRKYLEQFNDVYIYCEERYDPMNCQQRRQFLLDKKRELFPDDQFCITIDADEIISQELISVFLLMKNYLRECKGFSVNWWHVIGDIHRRLNFDTYQGFAFFDDGTNYMRDANVHEDKLPHGFPDKFTGFYHLDAALMHFGMCNEGFPQVKEAYYLYLKCLDGDNPSNVNANNLIHYDRKNTTPFHALYPPEVDEKIMEIDDRAQDYMKKFLDVAPFDLKALYQLDIWNVEGLLRACRCKVKGFNMRKVRHKRWKYPPEIIAIQVRLFQICFLIKTLQFKYLMIQTKKYFVWKLSPLWKWYKHDKQFKD